MTTIAPPLDTGGGAIFPYTDRNARRGTGRMGRAIDWERRDGNWDGLNMCSVCQPPDDAAIYPATRMCRECVSDNQTENSSTGTPINAKIAGSDRKTR